MSDLTAHVDHVVAELADIVVDGNPVRIVTDLARVAPPCIWVGLASIDPLASADEATVHVFLIGNAVDEYRAVEQLSPLLADVRARLSPTATIDVVSVAPTTGQRPLPALRFTTTTVQE